MTAHNGGHRPESKTTRMFRPVRQVAAPGAKSADSDCILFWLWRKRDLWTLVQCWWCVRAISRRNTCRPCPYRCTNGSYIYSYGWQVQCIVNVRQKLLLIVVKRTFLNILQNECCGLENANDWDANTNFTCYNPGSQLSCGVPDSCCKQMHDVRMLVSPVTFDLST